MPAIPLEPSLLVANDSDLELNITPLPVTNQQNGPQAHETCGYHTFKNGLLSLLFQQKIIDEAKYRSLLQSRELFQAIFANAKQIISGQGDDQDLTLPRLLEVLQKAKNGEYDFSEQDTLLNAENLKKLDLSKMSVSNFSTTPGAPEYALN